MTDQPQPGGPGNSGAWQPVPGGGDYDPDQTMHVSFAAQLPPQPRPGEDPLGAHGPAGPVGGAESGDPATQWTIPVIRDEGEAESGDYSLGSVGAFPASAWDRAPSPAAPTQSFPAGMFGQGAAAAQAAQAARAAEAAAQGYETGREHLEQRQDPDAGRLLPERPPAGESYTGQWPSPYAAHDNGGPWLPAHAPAADAAWSGVVDDPERPDTAAAHPDQASHISQVYGGALEAPAAEPPGPFAGDTPGGYGGGTQDPAADPAASGFADPAAAHGEPGDGPVPGARQEAEAAGTPYADPAAAAYESADHADNAGPAGHPEPTDGDTPRAVAADGEGDAGSVPAAGQEQAPAGADGGPDAPAAGEQPPSAAADDVPGPDEGPGAAVPEPGPEQPGPRPDPVPPTRSEHPVASYMLRVNGSDRPVTDAWLGESLLYVLRERLGLAGAKDGCEQGECGACSVQVDGRLVASCLVPAATAAGSDVRTVEGLTVDGRPSDVQRALADCGAVQCGFCVPGLAMTVHDLLEGNHRPNDLEVRQAISGNLCRCSGYRGVLEAVRQVIAGRAGDEEAQSDPDQARVPHQGRQGAPEAQG
ncbi:(2Fe-2S)-binding protein [Streptomyces sp. HPF1205]|uniref:(2Fe-2S)-binding protein n=1 Tax=Streptomyces sp. HPF1205 TaxID=2873262 RepID=UPI001CECDF8C|nr:(2Fe-2S)-binding protein [Streptomyces sp. HPF1205]